MTRPLLIRGSEVVVPGGRRRVDVLCRDGIVASVGNDFDLAGADAAVVDARGLLLGPGFVDVHVHGGGGSSFFTRDASRLAAFSAWAPAYGVTAFLVSTAGRHPADTARTLEGLTPAIGRAPGAESLGFHLEGPCLNPVRHGAFDPGTLRAPADANIDALLEAAEGRVRIVTLAPELPGALDLVGRLTARDIVAAVGHSDASYAATSAAFDRGVSHVTHLFNAMRPLHQREGGVAAASLLDDRVTCELICDGAHVAPEMLRLAWPMLGPERMIAVTDNMHLAGTKLHEAAFLGEDVSVRDGLAVRNDGTIVGSTRPMDGHFRTLVQDVGLAIEDAFTVCSANPARLVAVHERKGSIAPGFDADLVLLDQDLVPVLTVCRGAVAYEAARPSRNPSSTR